jgi:hypothetical protein
MTGAECYGSDLHAHSVRMLDLKLTITLVDEIN